MADNRIYTIGQLAKLSGISPRTLRHYESLGLINPVRTESGYRTYTNQDAKRLAHILSMKACGLTLSEIAELLQESAGQDVIKLLTANLKRLHEQQQALQCAIEHTQQALTKAERIEHMNTEQAFESMKQKAVETWDKTYGAEARSRYGKEAINNANEAMLRMTQQEWNNKEQLEQKVITLLKHMLQEKTPSKEQQKALVETHRQWVAVHWGAKPQGEIYKSLAQSYLEDERFKTYYDSQAGEGATRLLVAAIMKNA